MTLLIAGAVLALAAGTAAATPDEPDGAAPAAAPSPSGPRAGRVTLSDGTVLEGDVRLTTGRTLSLYETTLERRFPVALSEVARMTMTAEKEEMAQGWRFAEESSDKKVKLPFQYPLRTILTDVTLTSGQVLTGHVQAAPIYVRTGDAERKLLLAWEQKGEKDQTLADLVYVTEVAFAEAPPLATRGKLRIEGAEGAEICVVDCARDQSVDARDGIAVGLLAGRYDVFVRSKDEVAYGLTVEKDELTADDRAALQKRIDGIQEFFDAKKVVAAAGGAARTKALVELRRTRPSHGKDESGRPLSYVRWELWTLHKDGATWTIDARVFLFREVVEAGAAPPAPTYRACPALAGVEVGTKTTEVRVPPAER